MGYYDKTDARTLDLNVWTNGDLDFSKCYSATEAFEQALFANDGVVGNILKGFTTYPPQHLSPFGLTYRVRRIADVDEVVAARQVKRQRDHEARQAAKSYQSVTTLTFNREWDLIGKTVETRMVYTNKSGGMVIKTRSEGSPKVHLVDGKHVVVFYPHPWKNGRGDINFSNKAAKEIPAECPVLDNI